VSGLRSRQKLARRETMLAAASRLFDRQGYSRTTFEQIAAASNMGVATVYKYFGSKEGVVKALLTPDLERILENGQRIIARPPLDPAAPSSCCSRNTVSSRSSVGTPRSAQDGDLPGLGNEGVLASFVVDADTRVKTQIRELLAPLARVGRIARKLDCRTRAA
jgi:AcrR family transcriptional regulator